MNLPEIVLLSGVTGIGVTLAWDLIADRIHRRKNKALSDELENMGLVAYIDPPFGEKRTASIYIEPLSWRPGVDTSKDERIDQSGDSARNPNVKGTTMTEEQKPAVQPPETPLETKMNQSLTKAAEDLPYDLIGQKVRCWSHHQTNQCIEGRVSALSAWGVRLKAMEGKEFFVAWSAGPIVQILEY